MRGGLFIAVVVFAVGCGHLTKARPTPKDAIAVEVEEGGPMGIVGGAPIPLPLSTVGASYGYRENLDVAVHLHTTALAFGVAGVDVGSTWMPLPQDGWVPALGVTGRLYGFTDLKAARPYLEATAAASWLYADRFMTYVSASTLLQFGAPLFAVGAGEEVLLGKRKGLSLLAEVRWYEPTTDTRFMVVEWVGNGTAGAYGILLGARLRFGSAGSGGAE